MKYLESELFLGDDEDAEDALKSSQRLELRLDEKRREIAALPASAPEDRVLELELESAYLLLELKRAQEARELARGLFERALAGDLWLRAVEACDILYQAGEDDAIPALAHGIWLGVTFPIAPELSVAMLQHLIDETPDRSDGAAVAAATACYLVDLRADEAHRESLRFFTHQLLGQVARRHSQVEEQEVFDFWVERLELDDPDKFLPRLAQVLEVVANGDWWFDRDALRGKIPPETAP